MGGDKHQVDDLAPSSKSKISHTRIYQVWKGRNKFLCGGRLVFGPDGSSMILSAFLISAPAITCCVKMFLRIPTVNLLYGRIVLILGITLTLLDLLFLFLTSARNPGIIPRNSRPPESDANSVASLEWMNSSTTDLKLPRTKDIFINGHCVKVKYCDTCMLYRPPRASHCSICNNCVQRFDHHCPWVGQCIGVRNYKTFIMFITTSTVLCIYVFTFSLVTLINEPCSVWASLSDDIILGGLIVYCFIAVWFVGGLSMFHIYLICTNQTTYENFRYRYDKKENPYNQGMLNNMKDILLTKREPSLVNFREWVTEEDNDLLYSMTRKFGGDIIKQNGKIDLELGILAKEGKGIPYILQNLDYNGIDDSLKKDNAGKMVDPFFLPNSDIDEKTTTTGNNIVVHGPKVSSKRTSFSSLDI